MPTTDHGLYYPDDATFISPLHPVLGAMQESVNEYFDANVAIHPIATTAGRAALIAEYPPTATFPLVTWRADAALGRQLEITTNGSAWTAIGSDPATLTYNAQTLTGPQQAQVRDNIKTWPLNATTIDGSVVHLDTLFAPGPYLTTVTPGAGLGYPALTAGAIEVIGGPTSATPLMHRYTTFETSSKVFTRNWTGSAWTPWVQVSPLSVITWPSAKCIRTSTLSLASSTHVRLVYSSKPYDTHLAFNLSTGLFTVPVGQGGVYRVDFVAFFANSASPIRRFARIEQGSGAVNTGTELGRVDQVSEGRWGTSMSFDASLAEGEAISVAVWAAAANSIAGGESPSSMSVRRVS